MEVVTNLKANKAQGSSGIGNELFTQRKEL